MSVLNYRTFLIGTLADLGMVITLLEGTYSETCVVFDSEAKTNVAVTQSVDIIMSVIEELKARQERYNAAKAKKGFRSS